MFDEAERFGEDVCDLVLGSDVLNRNLLLLNGFSDPEIPEVHVLSPSMMLWIFDYFDASLIVLPELAWILLTET